MVCPGQETHSSSPLCLSSALLTSSPQTENRARPSTAQNPLLILAANKKQNSKIIRDFKDPGWASQEKDILSQPVSLCTLRWQVPGRETHRAHEWSINAHRPVCRERAPGKRQLQVNQRTQRRARALTLAFPEMHSEVTLRHACSEVTEKGGWEAAVKQGPNLTACSAFHWGCVSRRRCCCMWVR